MIAGGLGHFLLVDLATLWLRTSLSSWTPSSVVITGLEHTTLDFGLLGRANAYRAFAGFSVWVALSLSSSGVLFLRLAAQAQVKLRPLLPLCLGIAGAFFAVAAACFIWPAAVGGALATALFGVSFARGET